MVAPISASAAGMSPASRVCMNGSDIETSSNRWVRMAGTSLTASMMTQRADIENVIRSHRTFPDRSRTR